MRAVCQLLHGFRERKPLYIHDKVDDIPAGFAPETVVQLVLPVHGKGSGLLPVKGTKPPVIPSFFVQCHITGNDLNDVRSAPELVQPCGRITGSHFI
jgi:hypothetical protein